MIKEFQNYLLSIKGYSQNTITEYTKDINHFASWAQKHLENPRWSAITREHIDMYITSEVARGMKPRTTNRKIASISALYNYFKRQGLEVENPCRYESRRRTGNSTPNTIPTQDLKTAYDHATGATKFMLGLLITTGIRIQELLDMKWENINYEDNSIKIEGKGGNSRKVYTTSEVLEPAKRANDMNHPRGSMFGIDQRTARNMIFEALKPYSNAAQLSPHAIRHTFATNLASNGANVTTLATMMGHKQIKTTQKYIDLTQTNVAETFKTNNILAS